MRKYGNILIQNAPEESTQFLKKLCTDYRPSNKPLVDQVRQYISFRYFFVHLFATMPDHLQCLTHSPIQ
jgi:hypothetical protein